MLGGHLDEGTLRREAEGRKEGGGENEGCDGVHVGSIGIGRSSVALTQVRECATFTYGSKTLYRERFRHRERGRWLEREEGREGFSCLGT